MKYRLGLIMILTVFALSGCYRPIKGQVIDAETQQPIEGAVVLVEWTKTRGFGHTGTISSYKVVEVVSDKEGKIKIPGCYSPFVDPPDVTVYKKGYVAWNNHSIFPGTPRTFKWGDFIFKLEHFNPKYSHWDHTEFIVACIHSTLNDQSKRSMIKDTNGKKLWPFKKGENRAQRRPEINYDWINKLHIV